MNEIHIVELKVSTPNVAKFFIGRCCQLKNEKGASIFCWSS